MAGKVARYPTTQLRNAEFLSQNRSFGRTMEEDDVLTHLSDTSFDKRADILEQLKSMVRRNGGRLPFANQRNIFKGLSLALNDSNWDVRKECIQLVHELIPFLEDELDECMHILLPQLIPNLGHSKIAVRRAVIQTIHVYMKYTSDVQQILRAIVKHGLESPDSKTRKEVTIALPMLFTPEFSQENFYEIAQSLAKRLLECSTAEDGESLQQNALLSLSKIQNLVGKPAFKEYLDKLSPPLRKYYKKLINEDDLMMSNAGWSGDFVHYGPNGAETASRIHQQQITPHGPSSFSSGDQIKEFGVVPGSIMDRLNDQVNYRARAQAVEDLRVVIKELNDVHLLEPHILNFISYLNNLLDDPNFKISTVTLEIIGLLVEKMKVKIGPHLTPVVLALTKRMCDNKIVIRQLIMRIIVKQLMHSLSPKPVLTVVCENLKHKNSKVRQETLNIVIASLLTFPSYDFDLGYLCHAIARTLIDPKRQVRQAALESFAVLAQAMGAGKLQPLVQAVDSVEISVEGDLGVMAAVQARLARRQLPKLNADNLVDYATPIPNSAGSRGGGGASLNLPPGADVEWILQAPSSATSRTDRSDMDLESVTSSGRNSPNFNQEHRSSRRHSGKPRLPWDAENMEPNGSSSNRKHSGKTASSSSSRQRDSPDSSSSPTKPPKIKGQLLNTVPPYDQADTGSYRQTFLNNKVKRQSSDNIAQPFTVYNPSSDADVPSGRHSGGGYSFAPRAAPERNPRFSQSWSDPRMFEDAGMPNKRLLDPISGGDQFTAAEWITPVGDEKKEAPILAKPILHRSNSTSRGSGGPKPRKVPPISTSMVVDRADPEVAFVELGSGGLDSARDSAMDGGVMDDDMSEEMAFSLHSIRNSAASMKNKKASRAFQSRSPSPPFPAAAGGDVLEESGYLSNLTSTRDADSEHSAPPFSTPKGKKGRKPDAPFSNRPQMVHKNNKPAQQQQVQQSVTNPTFDPLGGVTFKANPSSDVAIIGTGYDQQHDNAPLPVHSTASKNTPQLYSNNKPKKKPQPTKGVVTLSPIGLANPYAPGPAAVMDWDEKQLPGAGGAGGAAISLEGRRMFDVGNSSSAADTTTGRRTSRTDNPMGGGKPPPGVYGRRVRHASSDKLPALTSSDDDDDADSDDDDDDDDDEGAMSMTQTQHISQKARQKEEEAEKKAAAERVQARQQARQAKIASQAKIAAAAAERRRQSTRPDQDSDHMEGLSISGNGGNSNTSPSVSKRPTHKPPVSKPANKGRILTEGLAKCDHGLVNGEPMAYENLEPYSDPNAALYAALQSIGNDEWLTKCDGLCGLRRLAKHHPDTLAKELGAVVLAVTAEVKNLRSSVCRMAAICIGEMCASLKKHMDPHVDKVTKLLLHRTGENAAKFLMADAEDALYKMTEHCSPPRVMIGLMNGVGHKNILVRKSTSTMAVFLVEMLGPGKVLTGQKDLTDKVLTSAAQFIKDSGPDTRYNGQKIFFMLMSDPKFEQQFIKNVPDSTRNDIKDKLETLRRKGLPDNPHDHSSARHRRTEGSRANSMTRGSSANSDTPVKAQPRSGLTRTDENSAEEIKSFTTQMAANDFRERTKAISRFSEMVHKNPTATCNNLTKIMDKFIPCLRDSNSKVALLALTTLHEAIPKIAHSLGGCTALTIETVASNLASKNKDIHDQATAVLDACLDHVDAAQLLQPFVSVAQGGNAKTKPDIIERVAYLVNQVYVEKPKLIKTQALPLLWSLLGQSAALSSAAGGQSSSSSVRTATTNLAQTIHSLMGDELYHHAKTTTGVTPRHLETLREMTARS